MSTEFDPYASNNAGRAFRIRKREKTRRTPDDLAFLAAYEAHLEAKAKAREEQAAQPPPTDSPASPAAQNPAIDAEPPATPPSELAGEPSPIPDPKPDPKPEPPKPPPPPGPKPPRTAPPKVEPPPRARAEAGIEAEVMPKRGARGDWRDRYKPKSEDGAAAEPREVVCVEVAKLGLAILNWMADGIRSIDRKPIIEPQQLGGSLVLLADQLLPGVAELTPEKMVIAGAAALAGQRLVLHAKIAAKAKQTAETSKHKSKMDDMRKTAEANHREQAAKQSTAAIPAPAASDINGGGPNGRTEAGGIRASDAADLHDVTTLAEHMNGSDWQPMPGDVW